MTGCQMFTWIRLLQITNRSIMCASFLSDVHDSCIRSGGMGVSSGSCSGPNSGDNEEFSNRYGGSSFDSSGSCSSSDHRRFYDRSPGGGSFGGKSYSGCVLEFTSSAC